ncbi:hypothetical protein BD311DRAFT_442462 [Dichomitus squalens]|uniref:Uncharacterized protein n=1 Tax=Dichomitus squalens TaxID=114155 RepID=A0A4Q9N3K3_9APHY|nr:hypothetical protein BD311DRAFT_442462 [Dichomitus squalens]
MAVIVFSPEAVCTCTLYPSPPRLRRNSEGLHLSPRNVCDTLGAAQFRRPGRPLRLRSGSHEPVFIRHASHATSYLNIVAGNRDAQRMACASFESRPCDATGSEALRALFHLPPCFELGLPCPFSPFANPPLSCSSALAGRSLLPRPNRQPLRCMSQPTAATLGRRGAREERAYQACRTTSRFNSSPPARSGNIISHLSKPSPAASGCRVSGIVCSECSRIVLSGASLRRHPAARPASHADSWCSHGPL